MKTFDRKDVFSVANAEEAQKYIGKEGYFADRLSELTEAIEGLTLSLDEIDLESDMPYCAYGEGASQLFLPSDKVKEVEEPKKYRPFKSTDEFLKFYKVGQVIHIKNKSDNLEQLTSIVAVFIRCYCCVCLGTNNNALPFEDLFKKYEININGNWQPFGVEE